MTDPNRIASGPVGAGQVIVTAASGKVKVPTTNLRTVPFVGVALETAIDGGSVQFQTSGPFDRAVTNLSAGVACAVGVNASGTPVRATDATCVSALNWVGDCDTDGTITIRPRKEAFSRPEDFGAKGDGITDDTAAIQKAVDVVACTIGNGGGGLGGVSQEDPQGIVQFAGGRYLCASPLIWNSKGNVTVRGSAQIVCTMAGSTDFIQLLSCLKMTFEDLFFTFTSTSYSGALFFASHTGTPFGNDVSQIHWLRCTFYGEPTHGFENARACIAMDGVTASTIKACAFAFAKIAILGQDPAYVNQILIEGCVFRRLGIASIKNPGEAWCVKANTFEPLEFILVDIGNGPEPLSPAINAVLQDLDYWCRGFDFTGNWVGDGGPVDGAWITLKGFGINISGNLISRDDDPGDAIRIVASNGVMITGNYLVGSTDFLRDELGNFNYNIVIAGNFQQSAKIPTWANVLSRAVLATGDASLGQYIETLDLPIRFGADSPGQITEPVLGNLSWTPGMIANETIAHTEIVLTGMHSQAAALCAGATPFLPVGVLLHADLVDAGVCRLTLHNVSGSPVTIGSSTFKVWAVR